MKRVWLLVGLAAAVALVFGGLALLRGRASRPKERPPVISVTHGSKDRLRRISLSLEGRTVEVERRDGTWVAPAAPGVVLSSVSVDNLVFVFTRLEAERVVAEGAVDLGQYGLDKPRVTGTASFDDGASVTLLLGGTTPARDASYLMVKGGDRIYSVSENFAGYLASGLPELRSKNLARIRPQDLTYLRVRKGEATAEFRLKTAEEKERYSLTFGNYLMTRPYRQPRGISSERFPGLLTKLDDLLIDEFVDDAPAGLARYGLASPWGELEVSDSRTRLHLLFGSKTKKGMVYFKHAEAPNVYAIEESRISFLRDGKPFNWVDKLVFIPDLPIVDRVEVAVGPARHVLEVSRPPEGSGEAVTAYRADGKEVPAEAFKRVFLGIVGLYVEGEVKAPRRAAPEVTVRFTLNTGVDRDIQVEYVPYDRTFYSVFIEGNCEFAISREQVGRMIMKLQALLDGKPVPE